MSRLAEEQVPTPAVTKPEVQNGRCGGRKTFRNQFYKVDIALPEKAFSGLKNIKLIQKYSVFVFPTYRLGLRMQLRMCGPSLDVPMSFRPPWIIRYSVTTCVRNENLKMEEVFYFVKRVTNPIWLRWQKCRATLIFGLYSL